MAATATEAATQEGPSGAASSSRLIRADEIPRFVEDHAELYERLVWTQGRALADMLVQGALVQTENGGEVATIPYGLSNLTVPWTRSAAPSNSGAVPHTNTNADTNANANVQQLAAGTKPAGRGVMSGMPKYQYYQDDAWMKVQILEPNVALEDLTTVFTANELTVKICKREGGSMKEYTVIHGHVWEEVIPEKCRAIVKESKVLIKLKKRVEKVEWSMLLDGSKAGDRGRGFVREDRELLSSAEAETSEREMPGEEGGDMAPSEGIHFEPTPTTSDVKRVYGHEQKLRSQRSRQRHLQKNAVVKKCEHCGVDDLHYKLRACSGCQLALYCSVACQKAARGSHQRICDIIAHLPPRSSDILTLRYDKGVKDFDAGLRYATKYMDNLRHLDVGLTGMRNDDKVKFSTKKLSSLFRSKKGALDSVFLISDQHSFGRNPAIFENSYEVWKEAHGLKQLCLQYMLFDDVQHICDIIHRQSEELVSLSLPYLESDWNRASCRKAFASAISSCKKLVKLHLHVNTLQDVELEVLLNDLPNLRVLNLRRNVDYPSLRGLTDKSCAIFGRKCPYLQELSVDHHDKLSVKGIRKILKGCIHLRSFCTTTRNLSRKDIMSLLNIAPQLLCLSLGEGIGLSTDDIDEMIETTGGRTLFRFGFEDGIYDLESSGSILSAATREKYKHGIEVFETCESTWGNPEVINKWGCMFEDNSINC